MRIVKEDSTHTEVVRSCLKKQMRLSQKTDDFEMHQTVGFGTHLTVDGDARLITRPA
jgi:hypothetical protein